MTPEKRIKLYPGDPETDIQALARAGWQKAREAAKDALRGVAKKELVEGKMEEMAKVARDISVDIAYIPVSGPIIIFRKDGVGGVSQPERQEPTGQK